MKIPSARKLKSGTWFIQLRLNGVSVPVTGRTEAECRNAAQLIKAEHKAGVRQIKRNAPQEQTLKSVLEEYIKKREPVRSPSTIRGYTQIKGNRFQDYMDKPVGKIPWQEMINAEVSKCSAKTLSNSWGLVRSSLADAGIPVPNVELAAVPVKEIPFLQPEEIKLFCEAIKGDIAEIGLLLELQGLRRSEALGLDWKDVDLKNKTIFVHGSRVQNKDGQFVNKDTAKNKSSSRRIPIMIPQLEDALSAVKLKQGRVVTVAENTMLKHTKEACKIAGVTVVGNHGLRHSFASLGYHLGISERQLMEMGGWSDYTTMHKIYIRVASKDKEAANNAISDFFKKTPDSVSKTVSKTE